MGKAGVHRSRPIKLGIITLSIFVLAMTAAGGNAPRADSEEVVESEGNSPTSSGTLTTQYIESDSREERHLPSEISDIPGVGLPSLSAEVNSAITTVVQSSVNESINTVVWDSNEDAVVFYVHGSTTEVQDAIHAAFPVQQKWRIESAAHSRRELESMIEGIAANPSVFGEDVSFVSAQPSADGKQVSIGVEAVGDGQSRSQATLLSLPSEIGGVSTNYSWQERPQTSERQETYPPVISGGRMKHQVDGMIHGCTTGFPVTRNADNQPNLLTADHCEDDQGVAWGWGQASNSLKVGNSTFQAAGGTDLELFTDNQALSPYMYIGTSAQTNLIIPIRGYYAPVGGNNVCYNGGMSGTVCGNLVENTDSFWCVALLQCYWVRDAEQVDGIPAAGNGDSGGPVLVLVVRASDNTVGAYGIGVISMLRSGSDTCTGEPGGGGRQCSMYTSFAPLSRWTAEQYTHSLVGTTE